MRPCAAVFIVCGVALAGCVDDPPCDCADAAGAVVDGTVTGDAGVAVMDAARLDAAAADASVGDPDAGVAVDGGGHTDTATTATWSWATAPVSDPPALLADLAVAGDSVVITGLFRGDTVAFGPHRLTRTGDLGLLIAKYDREGRVLWARTATSTGRASGNGVAVASGGRIFVTGEFQGQLSMDGATLMSTGLSDVFLLVLDPDGNVVAAKTFGGTNHNDHGITVAASGDDVYLGGYFFSRTVQLDDTALRNRGNSDGYVVRFDEDLRAEWVTTAAGEGAEQLNQVAVGANGEAVVCGNFASSPLTVGTHEAFSGGSTDLFWARLSATGASRWVRAAGGRSLEYFISCGLDSRDDVYLAGTFASGEIRFGDTLLRLTNRDPFSNDMFVAKYSASGEALWAFNSQQATSEATGRAVAVDASDRIYVVGGFYGVTSFGDHTLDNEGENDLYLIEVDPEGVVQWALGAGGEQDDDLRKVAAAPSGVYVLGSFKGSQLRLGATTLASDSVESTMFLAKVRRPSGR